MNQLRSAGRTLRRHPRWTGLGALVVLAAVGLGTFFGVTGGSTATAAAQTTTTTETVSTGTVKQSVTATGTLAPAVDDTLTFGSSGVVESVLVAEGQTVTVGQALATINSAALAATAAQAAATVANDQAKVATDESDDATAAQLAADRAALAAAQTQLTSAQAALAGATLTSPVAGVVASVGMTVGQSVSGSGSAGAGSATGGAGAGTGDTSSTATTSTSSGIQVISTDSWLVNATVDSTSVDLIATGDQAQLTVSGATAAVYGTISSIAVLSSSTGTTASYPVVVAVTGSPAGLHDGETVTAALIYNQVANAITVPTAALHRTSTGDTYVDRVVNGKTVQTTVAIGIASGQTTQITSGLASGDQVLVTQTRPTTGTNGGSTTTRGGTGGTGGGFPGGTGGFGGPPGAAGGGAAGGGLGG